MLNKLILSNLGHRPIRTVLSILAIAIEVTMMLTLVGVSHGTLDAAARRARGVGADILFRPPGSSAIALSTAPMSDKIVTILMQQPHITYATGTTIQPLSGFDSITGLDLKQMAHLSGGFNFIEGGPFVHDNDMIVDEYYAREKHLKIGSKLNLINHDWNVVGIFESGKLARICVKIGVLQDIIGSPNRLSQVYLKVDDPSKAHAIVEALHATYPGYQIYTMEEFTSLLTVNSVGMLRTFINVVIGIAVVVGFIAVFMAMYTAVHERTREIGILKAVGGSSSLIIRLLFQETLLLAVLGTVMGVALTYVSQWIINDVIPSSLTQETVYAWWPTAGAIAIVGALLGTIFPAVKAIRQDTTEAISYE